jgi:hypothetical protein
MVFADIPGVGYQSSAGGIADPGKAGRVHIRTPAWRGSRAANYCSVPTIGAVTGPPAARLRALAIFALHPYFPPMLAKLTAKNQVTLPKRALDALGRSEMPTYFEVAVEGGRIILTPARIGSADAVRRKLAELGVTEADVADAIAWARQPQDRGSGPV